MIKNDKIDALIILSGNALVVKNLELFKNTDTSDVVRPKSLDRRVQRNINKEHRRKEYGSFYVFAKRCAAAVLIVCTVSFAIAMSIPPVRAAFFNAIVKFFEEYLTIAYISEGTAQTLKWLEEIESNNECCTISQLAVNGKDLEKKGLKGEEIGNALNSLLDAVIENKVENTKADLLTYIL